ncbi:hypothetical protein M885DRAFT_619882 [Pelagophyceae sp. CCMP2097]|nr:hypothetical protein M885DRAFT_619882 [Pelagophyceae sp. CCMP2097]
MSDDVNAAVDRLRRQAALIRTAVAALERDLRFRPKLDWADALGQFNGIKRLIEGFKDETDPLLNYFALTPKALPMNANDIPTMLSTRKLPVMEARDLELTAAGAALPLGAQRIERHNALVESLLDALAIDDDDAAPARAAKAPQATPKRCTAWPDFL